jgi:uncharacterized damage-inducible protein DinB
MPATSYTSLLEALLDSWDRNNTILTNLVRALPEGGLDARVMESSPSVAQMLTHIHYVRMVFVSEDAREFAPNFVEPGKGGEWATERDRERLVAMLNESAKTVRDAVKGRLEAGRAMDRHYDHPILMLQHMIWHEGYHHGQIKLALKLAGAPLANKDIGPLSWRLWMQKTPKKAR